MVTASLDNEDTQRADVSNGAPRRTARRSLAAAALGLIAIPTIFVVAVRGYEFWAGFEQDRCSFGTVSNERYREWLAKATEVRRHEGAVIDNGYKEVPGPRRAERANNIRFDQLSRGVTSLDERIAISHAMMRAEGFRLRSVLPDSHHPFEETRGTVVFRYKKFALLGVIFACAFGCEHRAFTNFYVRGYENPPSRAAVNQFDILAAYEPNLVSGAWAPHAPETLRPSCPPMPSPEWTARFMQSLNR